MMNSAYKLNKQSDNIQPWRIPFPIQNQSVVPCLLLTVASWPPYRFCRRQVRWSGIPISLRIFQFVVIHIVKGFSVINGAEVNVSLEFSCFFYDPVNVSNLIPGSSAFLNPAWTSGSSRFMYCWSLAWRILSISLLVCEMNEVGCKVWMFFGIALLWDWNENWPFPVLWPLLKFGIFQICGTYWVQHFNSIIF